MNTSKLLKSEINQSKHLMGLTEEKKETKNNSTDTITMDVPLFIRMLEYAKEDAKTDMDLHVATEKALELLKKKDVLCMDCYDYIVGAKKK
jgi:3-hydroxy-3-methylglutaryl CoA synthase